MRVQRKERQKSRALAIGLDARMIAHSGIGMRIRGLLKYLGPIAVRENLRIYLFGDVTTILNEGILCYEFSSFEKSRSETETSNHSSKKKKIFLIL